MLSPPGPAHCATTRFTTGSMRVMGKSNIVTHTAPSPKAISPPSPGTPAGIVASSLFVFAFTRETLPSPWFKVQIDPAPAVKKRGFGPTGTVAVALFVPGSTLVTRFFSVDVTHTAPSSNAAANDPGAMGMEATIAFVFGSTRDKVPLRSVVSQTLPAPVAIPPSDSAGGAPIVATICALRSSTRRSERSPQLGIQIEPKPAARPEQGLFTVTMDVGRLVVASSRTT